MNSESLNINDYEKAVINGIVERFPERDRNGVHAINYKYVEQIVSEFKNEHNEYELPHPEILDTCWSDFYQNNQPVEEAIDAMYEAVKTLYYGHMSVL